MAWVLQVAQFGWVQLARETGGASSRLGRAGEAVPRKPDPSQEDREPRNGLTLCRNDHLGLAFQRFSQQE